MDDLQIQRISNGQLACMKRCFAIGTLIFLFATHAAADAGDARTLRTVDIGPSVKAWNYVGITQNFAISDHVTSYVTGGLGSILVGGGVAYHSRGYDQSGLVAAATIGLVGYHLGLAYQWRLDRRSQLSIGVVYGTVFMQYAGWLPVVSYGYRF